MEQRTVGNRRRVDCVYFNSSHDFTIDTVVHNRSYIFCTIARNSSRLLMRHRVAEVVNARTGDRAEARSLEIYAELYTYICNSVARKCVDTLVFFVEFYIKHMLLLLLLLLLFSFFSDFFGFVAIADGRLPSLVAFLFKY